jgi:4-amino-4-deoxy-L-arabinose transferase-like glycosyltransferase
MGARNIMAGNGYVEFSGEQILRPNIHYPPLYPYLLAAIGLTGMDAIRAARLLNIICMALSLLLFSGLIFYETRNKPISILAGLLFLFSVPLFVRYTWALTEALFFTLLIGNIVVYYLFLKTRRSGWVVALGLGTAFLYLTRYVSIYLLAVWLPAIYLLSTKKNRLKNIIVYLAGLFPLITIHALRNYLLVGSINNRSIYMKGMLNASSKVVSGLDVLESWFSINGESLASHTVTLVVVCLLAALLLVGLVLSGLKLRSKAAPSDHKPGREAILFPLFLVLILYVCTVLLTVFFYDSKTLLEDRILSPMYFFGLYILIIVADMIYRKGRLWMILTLVCLLACLAFSVGKFQYISKALRSDGQGYISEKWRVLPEMEYIRQTNHNLIYSNQPLVSYILTGKVVYQVPFTEISKNKTYTENYQHYDFMRAKLLESDGILILFDPHCSDLSNDWFRLLTRDLRLIEQFANSCVYSP